MLPSDDEAARVVRDRLGLITPDELNSLIGISAGTAKNRTGAGSMPPHYSVGNRKLYKLADVEAWLRRRRVAVEPKGPSSNYTATGRPRGRPPKIKTPAAAA